MMTSRRRKRNKRNRRIKVALVVFAELLLLCVVLVCAWAMKKMSNINTYELPEGETVATNQFQEPTYAEVISDTFTTYVVFGVDAREAQYLVSGSNSDVLIIVSINNRTNEIKLASIYRDTYAELSDGSFGKINSELTKRGAFKAMEVLNKNYDLNLDGFICVNWAILANVVDRLGGMELEITDSMMTIIRDGQPVPYINGLITEIVEGTGIPSTHIQNTGMQLCDGVQTVAYCRLRYNDSDFKRTERQRQVIAQMLSKVKSASLPTINAIADDVLSSIATSLSDDELLKYLPIIAKLSIADTTGFPFNHREASGYFSWAVMPVNLEANVVQLHEFLFGTEDYQVSNYVKNLSEKLRVDGGFDENFNYIGD